MREDGWYLPSSVLFVSWKGHNFIPLWGLVRLHYTHTIQFPILPLMQSLWVLAHKPVQASLECASTYSLRHFPRSVTARAHGNFSLALFRDFYTFVLSG